MDLIAQLINVKKSSSELPLMDVLTELVKYEKLSRSDKFKHITDTPILQKQLPICWSAFNNDAEAYWLLHEASIIMQAVSTTPLVIFDDLAQHYSKKRQKQLEIIGNTNKYLFVYRTIREYAQVQNHNESEMTISLSNQSENGTLISLIIKKNKNFYIYQGEITLDNDIDTSEKTLTPFTLEQNDDKLIIHAYSNQGNNDYDFGVTNNFFISMPTNAQLAYKNKNNPKDVQIIDLSDDDERTISFHSNDLKTIGKMIFKYMPNDTDTKI